MPKLNMETLLPFIEEAFNRGKDFRIPVTGTSMNPLLYQNRDFVKIIKPTLPLTIGDIPLYRRKDGAFVLHRVVDIKDNGEYVMCGDNQFILEHGITDANIIGIAKTLIIDGREIDVDKDPQYIKHKEKFVKNVGTRYPVRRLRYKLHFVKKKFVKPAESTTTVQVEAAEKEKIRQDILLVGKILVDILKADINNEEYIFPDNTNFLKLFKLAQSHRITAMVAPFVLKSSVADASVKGAFSKELFKSSARYTAQEREAQELSEAFSQLKIRHCFLKGVKVGSFYKNPDARFMLDMDLFVEKESFALAEQALISRGYECVSNGDEKDTTYNKKPFLILELHKELKYDYDKGYDYYKGAFDRMISSDGYRMDMTPEDFYVYILSHAAHHFSTGGTGIKSITDHYYLKEKLRPLCDSKLLVQNLKAVGLLDFAEKMDALCDFWFNSREPEPIISEMSDFVILSGVFGNRVNGYLGAVKRGDFKDSKGNYFLKRLFPEYKTMSIRYPILKKHSALLPLYWGIRLATALFNPKALKKETNIIMSVDDAEKNKYSEFIDNIGL